MGRKERRRFSKQQRREKALQYMDTQEIREFKKQAYENSNKHVIENLMPVFILYLIEHFRCRERGVIKFMDWFNKMQEWLDGNPEGFEEIKAELQKRQAWRLSIEKR